MSFVANISQTLTEKFGPLGPMIGLLAAGLALVAVALAVMLKKTPEPFDKLKAQRQVQNISSTEAAPLRQRDRAEKLERFASFLEPQDAEQMSASRLKMLRAGYRDKNAVRLFHFAQFTLGIGALAIGVIYSMFLSSSQEVNTQGLILSTLFPGVMGYYLPQYWVQRRAQTRTQEIISGFPDALDLMLVCVEAGQSLDQSIIRVAKETRAGYPALADEFEIVANEVKAGKERVQVLKDMSERVGIADVSSFVTTLVQSATFGTSIAEALRVYSAEMRDKRVMRAEEKANVLPTKLTLGTMMFTVPPLMIILIGPSVYGITQTLGGQ
ncbi:type II secretion system F family protein [Neotabrizicola shimadae]|uniref:Type II secretion system F family protein n=1 Tax=Neotabrizicola shimadae TaxID=2807096 RepID=A0A8G1EER0_9RHOB|nr:type II secretion system F family protein [Neotabrizicola shimadae]QYZ71681.1 type II secretion system F family protein [Neotabrizicola shimadae]